ncbi:MAG: hypothetical protein WC518_03745 [Patescibacteria group bacterium]
MLDEIQNLSLVDDDAELDPLTDGEGEEGDETEPDAEESEEEVE